MAVERRVGGDVYADPYTECQEPAVPASHDDDKV